MNLIQPGIGLIVWMLVAFVILFLLLKKFAFPIIFKMLKEREESISSALNAAEKARQEIEGLQDTNAKLLKGAKEQRDEILKQADILRAEMLEKAKTDAKNEYDKILTDAKIAIKNEQQAAITEIKNDIANLSLEIALKIIEKEIKKDEISNAVIEKAMKNFEI
ncbi:MAG: F0F1 ATP synthase subunit B [Bacteroidales bacterium]|nr:F0F1 ATP synthase subunit B [Bacteroidales bacterium]